MLSIQVALTELKRIFRSRMLRVTLVGVCIIPLLYGALYLWAFWDPYGKLDKIPVVVVNLDQGGIQDGTSKNLGKDLVKELKNNKVFDWHFVANKKDAEKGLRDKKYYVAIEVPNEFTQKVLSVKGNKPEAAELNVINNESKNMLAGQISSRVLLEINDELNNKITKEYFDNIFAQTKEGTQKLSEAATGTDKMLDGSRQLGAGDGNLSKGLKDIDNGSYQLKDGISSLNNGSGQVVNALAQTSAGGNKLAAALEQAVPGINTINQGLTGTKNSVDTIAIGSLGVQQGLVGVNDLVNGALANMSAGNYTETENLLLQAKGLMNDHLDSNNPGMIALQSNIVNGLKSGGNGGNNISDALGQLQKGVGQLSSQTAYAASTAKTIAAGDTQTLAGAKQISQGLQASETGANALQAGADKAYNGSLTLGVGQKSLDNGIGELQKGLKSASATKIPDGKAIQIMSKPVQMEKNSIFKVPTYGTGFAPYFIPLSLWVGALVLFFLVGLKENRLAISPLGNYPVVLGKFLTLGVIGVIQSLILSVVLIYGLGLHVDHPVQFYLINILLSLCFISIMQPLVATFDNAGRFIAVVLLMLQLTSSAGTFPKETLPHFFQAINPFLPMTYGVAALREVITGSSGSSLSMNVLVIVFFTLLALAINMFTSKRWFNLKDLKPAEEI